MASLLRFRSIFPRYLLNLQRFNPTPIVTSFSSRVASINQKKCDQELTRSYATRSIEYLGIVNPQRSRFTLEDGLKRLNANVRKTGRLTLREFSEVYDKLKTNGSASSLQALLMLRCCGSVMVEEIPEKRNELLNDVLDTFKNKGIEFDISHYNALLQVYLENEFKFVPDEFLNTMQQKGVVPNRVTYQRFIEHFCQLGDMEGARKMLQHMKEKELPINERIFNSLIMGHGRAHDLESAKGTLDIMKGMTLEPSIDTYVTLICAYAENGEIKPMNDLIAEVDEKGLRLLNMDYLNIIYSLAKYGHIEHISPLLENLNSQTHGFVNEAITTIHKLFSIDLHELAFLLLKKIDPATKPSGELWPCGSFFIRRLVQSDLDPKIVVDYTQKMEELKIYPHACQKAAERAYIYGKFDHFVAILNLLKNKGFPVRAHYFSPFFVACMHEKNMAKVYDILKVMAENECSATFTMLADYVLPALMVNNDVSNTEIIKNFQKLGYTPTEVAGPMAEYYVEQGYLKEAASLASQYDFRMNSRMIHGTLAKAYLKTENVSSTIELLDSLSRNARTETGRYSRTDWPGLFLLHCFQNGPKSHKAIEVILNALRQSNMEISNESYETITNRYGFSMPDNMKEMMKAIAISSSTTDSSVETTEDLNNMSVDQLKAHLEELKNNNMPIRRILRQLFIQHCRNKDVERVKEIKAELDKDKFICNPSMLAQLVDLFVVAEDLESARQYFNELQSHSDAFVDDYKILNYAALLVKKDQVEEAIKLLKEWEPKRRSDDDFLENNVWRVLNACADKKDVQLTENMFNLLKDKNCCPVTSVMLSPIVKVYAEDDLDKAIEKFEEIVNTYKFTPWRQELFMKLIMVEDQQRLQKLVDLNNEIHGERNTLHDLAFSFIDCGRTADAVKILTTPGLRALQPKLEARCERYLKRNQIHELEELIKATQDAFDVDRDKLYLHLFRAYYNEKNPKKALDAWTMMQEENVLPSNETLIFLGKFLEEFNEKVPFAIPDEQVMLSSASDSVPRSRVRRNLTDQPKMIPQIAEMSAQIHSLVENGDIEEAVKLTHALLDNNNYPSPRTFRFLMNEVAKMGDIETIKAFEPKLTEDMKKIVRFNNIRFSAHIHGGAPDVVLQELEKDVTKTEACPAGSFLLLLRNNSGYLDRVEKLAKEYTKQGYYGLLNSIWMHHFMNENYVEADKILKATPQFSTSLVFGSVLREAERTLNIAMLEKLLSVVKETQIPVKALGKIYSNIITIQMTERNIDDALKTLEKAKLEGADETIHPSLVQRLKQNLERQGQTLPQSLESKVRPAGSDDSDSDLEDVGVSTKQS